MFGLAKGWTGTYLVGIFGGLAILGVVVGIVAHRVGNGEGTAKACTTEAKLCSDGSYVGRTGESCEFAACPTAESKGTVKGKISVGPLCPVEPCHIDANPLSGKVLVITFANGKTVNAQIDSDGSFLIMLPPGDYTISMDSCQYLGCNRVFPVKVTVEAGRTVEVNIKIDTGIR